MAEQNASETKIQKESNEGLIHEEQEDFDARVQRMLAKRSSDYSLSKPHIMLKTLKESLMDTTPC